MGTFYTIPHGCSLITTLCRLLKEILPKDYSIGHSTVVVPSQNAAFYLKRSYIQGTQGAIFLPKIISLKSLVHEKVLLSAIQPSNLVSRWEKLGWLQNYLKGFFQDFKASQRLEVAQSLLDVMDELQKHHVTGELIQKLGSYASSDKWQNSLDILFDVVNQWQKFLEANNKIEKYAYYESAVKDLSENLTQHCADYPFVWVGMQSNDLSSLSKLRFDLIKRILSLPQGAVIFEEALKGDEQRLILEKINQPSVVYNDVLDDFALQRNNLIKKAFLNEGVLPNGVENAPIMLEQATAYDEAKFIALIVRYHLYQSDQAISIVTKNRQLTRIIEGELARWKIPVNNAMGVFFSKTVAGVFLKLVSDLWSDQSWSSLVNLLKHPLCFKDNRQEVLKLVRYLDVKILRSSRLITWSWDSLAKMLPIELKNIWERFLTIIEPILTLEEKNSLSNHLELHESVAQKLVGEAFAQEADGHAAKYFFDELSKFSAGYEWFDRGDYPKAFEALVQKLDALYFDDSINTSVRILRPDEALWCGADVMILAGLNEGAWPNLKSQDHWLSHGMRSKLGMDNILNDADWDAHDFCHLLSAKKLYLTRSHMEDQKPTTPSRFWRRIQSTLGHHHDNNSNEPWMDWLNHLNGVSNIQEIKINPPEANPAISVRPKKMSATEVELLLRDPYGLYIKRCLNLKPLEPISAGINAAQKGQIFHEILHRFVKNYPKYPTGKVEIEQLIDQSLSFVKNQDPYLYFLMRNKILKIIDYVINYLNDKEPTKILSEVRGEHSFSCSGESITLSATADRIDIADGQVDIIDYKNGTPPSLKSVEDLLSPQLMIEALLWHKNCFGEEENSHHTAINISYWHLKANDLAVKISSLKVDDEFLIEAESKFIDLFNTMLCQEVPFKACPYPEAIPVYHPYTQLERLDEWIFTDH